MAEANGSSVVVNLMSALNRTLHAYDGAGRAIPQEQENRELRLLGGRIMVAGVLMTAASYRAVLNIPPAIPNYIHVIPFLIQWFTFVAGIFLIATGWFLVVSDDPRQYGSLVKIILFIAFIASAFTMGSLL